ncbi:MAG: PQQ-binding-like beta-propeller repeat protein [Bryobacteraceae bacterium]|nr:PQQ-binding-like beta-propeller repeat protein [Bryobacteraceae bacterium]MDW8379774.1 PQQ-binding-like beta-propeller repeat protein [Bryobacterales bacterium]
MHRISKNPFVLATFGCLAVWAEDWPQFRGANGQGVSASRNLPVEFGPEKNVVWKTPLPPGHSSPVIAGNRIFVTAYENDKLFTVALDRETGKVVWRREAPRPRKQELHKANSPVSPSPVTDGRNVFVFFTDFGLLSYGPDGNERWRTPLGPFNNPFGMGASPVLVGRTLLQACDAESGSFFAAFDAETGKQKWRVERPEYTRGFSTPVIYRPPDGPVQAILAGSYQLTSYDVETGQEVWFFRGLTWQLKPTPVLGKDAIYVLGWAGGSDTGQQEQIPPFEDVLKSWDADKDGKLSKQEVPDPKITKDWRAVDLDDDGVLGARDWRLYQSRRSAQNAFQAIKLGPKGDISAGGLLWRYTKTLPNVPSPLLYHNVLYLIKEGGILTTLDPATGDVIKQGRLQGALSPYFASPVAGDGKVYVVSEAGNVVVLKAAGEWEVLAVNNLEESCHATPAIVDDKIYIRTHSALYCFAKKTP